MPDSPIKRYFRLLTGWPAVIALAVSCLVLQPGILEFDERAVFEFSTAMVAAHFHWNAFTALLGGPPSEVLNHEYALFLLQVAAYWPYWLLSRVIHVLGDWRLGQFFMALVSDLPIWAGIWVGWKLLRNVRVAEPYRVLALAGIFGGSYATSVLVGTRLINLESLLILLQMLMLTGGRSPARSILMGLMGGYLIALRPYDAADAFVLLFLFLPDWKRPSSALLFWMLGFGVAIAVGFASKFLLPVPARLYANEIQPVLGSVDFVPVYLSRLAGSLFSFSYGLPWTMPFLFFAAASPDRRALPAKGAAILAVTAFTALFPFWAGQSGTAGNRYLFPQLMLLLPEMGLGFQLLARRCRALVFVIPVLVLLFLPCAAFRHNVTYDYAVGDPSFSLLHPIVGRSAVPLKGQVSMPLWNPLFQPGLFAWWQLAVLIQGRPMLLSAASFQVSLDPRLVPPDGLLPRLIYLNSIDATLLSDSRVVSAAQFVARLPRWMPDLVYVLSALISLFWASLIALAMRMVFLEPPAARQAPFVAKAGT